MDPAEIKNMRDVKEKSSAVQKANSTPESLLIDTFSMLPKPQLKLALVSDQPKHTSQQAEETFNWLTVNYESCGGFSLPKSLIYDHYTAFCQERGFTPVNATIFGKVIRNAFPSLTTRRLGARTQSRYHYYGLKMRSSDDLPVASTHPSVSRQEDFFLVAPNQVQPSGALQSAQSQHFGSALNWTSTTLLPEFPDASNLGDTHGVEAGQVNYLISSYRSHCIQVLETVLRGGLSDVGFLIQHFWQHLNESIKDMLYHVYLGDTIAVCDTHLYHTIINVLIPGTVQPLPATLLRAVRNFACYHVEQVEKALKGLPDHLINAKIAVAKRFANMLSRKTALAHLAQASRGIICSTSNSWHMKDDWEKRTELGPDCRQTAWTSYDQWGLDNKFILKKLESYSELLEAGRTVEEHIHWLEMLVKGLTDHIETSVAKTDALRSLLLQWSYLSHLLIRDQTLRSAVSFGSFHLLNLLYQEYLMYVADIHNARLAEEVLWKNVFGQQSQASTNFLTQPVMCDLEECNLGGSTPRQPDPPGTASDNTSTPDLLRPVTRPPTNPTCGKRWIVDPIILQPTPLNAPGQLTTLMPVGFALNATTPVISKVTGNRASVVAAPPSSTQSVIVGACRKRTQIYGHKASLKACSQGSNGQASLTVPKFECSSMLTARGCFRDQPDVGGFGALKMNGSRAATDHRAGNQTPLVTPEPGIFEPTVPEPHQFPTVKPPYDTLVPPAITPASQTSTVFVSKVPIVAQPSRVVVQQTKSYKVRCAQHAISGESCQTASKKPIKILPMPPLVQQQTVGKAGDATRTLEPIAAATLGPQPPKDRLEASTEQVLFSEGGESIVVGELTSDTMPAESQVVIAN